MLKIILALTLLLGIASSPIVYAQESKEELFKVARSLPGNQQWGWFTSLSDFSDKIQSGTGWEQTNVTNTSTTNEGETQTVEFFNKKINAHAVGKAWDGALQQVVFLCSIDNKDFDRAMLGNATQVESNKWVQIDNNASIVRRYDGENTVYFVTYMNYEGVTIKAKTPPIPRKIPRKGARR